MIEPWSSKPICTNRIAGRGSLAEFLDSIEDPSRPDSTRESCIAVANGDVLGRVALSRTERELHAVLQALAHGFAGIIGGCSEYILEFGSGLLGREDKSTPKVLSIGLPDDRSTP